MNASAPHLRELTESFLSKVYFYTLHAVSNQEDISSSCWYLAEVKTGM